MAKRHDPISDRVAENIARLRQERRYTGERLVERCAEFGLGLEPPVESSINIGIISKIETGLRTVSVTELVLFAGALGVTINTLTDSTVEIQETPYLPLEARVTALEQSMARLLDQ